MQCKPWDQQRQSRKELPSGHGRVLVGLQHMKDDDGASCCNSGNEGKKLPSNRIALSSHILHHSQQGTTNNKGSHTHHKWKATLIMLWWEGEVRRPRLGGEGVHEPET